MTKHEEELKSLLMKVKEESDKAGLKLNIQKTMIMESSPITLWQIDGEKMETMKDFIFLGSKITVDNVCQHEIKGHLFLGINTMANLGSVLKSRQHIKKQRHYFANKYLYSQSFGFPSSHVQMSELDHKELWSWKRQKAGGEGDDRGCDGWMVSLAWWSLVCACSGRWYRTGKTGMLQSVGFQRVGHSWKIEQQQLDDNLHDLSPVLCYNSKI